MASFLLSEVYLVERVLASGHPDLDDLTCEATVCTTRQQAYCEAIRNMISAACDHKNCEAEEEECLRLELVKAMRKKGFTPEKRYLTLKEIIINASHAFQAEKTYYNVKSSSIVPHRDYDDVTMCSEALHLLGEPEKAADAPGSSSRNVRDRGRALPPLSPNEEGLSRKKAREHKH
ncbi:hypothetical protein M758_1G133900 [Ceratodon purpureus]|nr:hypothetical protein M758_1G133900 [Ceratodon purpureus]KAG0629838.1 hypothetical protein M758_1G133900 [Ceratodon purpureus]